MSGEKYYGVMSRSLVVMGERIIIRRVGEDLMDECVIETMKHGKGI